jgi:uncharacterized protein YndB with AHSA1/START domain
MRHQRSISITRVFDAPLERVFAAWTRAEMLAHWFGPQGFSVPACESDPRPGGVFRLCMRSPEGKDYWVRGTYREVRPAERLVIDCVADDAGGVQRLEEVIDVTFAAQGARTRLTVNCTSGGPSPEAAQMLKGMDLGWSQSVDKLGAELDAKSSKRPQQS